MKISVITICLNAVKTIEETFSSVLEQTYKDVELIVIDGGSTDGTLEVIDNYKEKISCLVSEADNGLYDAMNKGIKLASGDFIIFMNSGDTFYNNLVLEKAAAKLIENPEVQFLFGDADCVLENKKSSYIQTYQNIQTDFSLALYNICHQCIFYHQSLFKKLGSFDEEYQICSDWDFNIRCLVKEKIPALYLPIPIAKFNLEGISSKKSSQKKIKAERKIIINEHFGPFAFFILKLNNFFKNHMPAIHKFIHIFLSITLCKFCLSKRNQKLNIKKY